MPESLEQRALMAVDSFAATASCAVPDDFFSSVESINVAPCFVPMDVSLLDTSSSGLVCATPMCCEPSLDLISTDPTPEADFWVTPDYLHMMAVMTAEADVEAQRHAEEEARWQADMQAQMAAFFSLESWCDGGDTVGDPECVAMPSGVCEVVATPACGPEDGSGSVVTSTVDEAGAIECETGSGYEAPDICDAGPSMPGGVFIESPIGFVMEASSGVVTVANQGHAWSDTRRDEASIGLGDPAWFAALPDGSGGATGAGEADRRGPGVATEEAAISAAGPWGGSASDAAAVTVRDDGVGSWLPEPAVLPEESTEIDYGYDWEAEAQKQLAEESRERLIYAVCEYANALNIESEGRFAEGIVYTEAELVDRLKRHIDAPQAIEGVEYIGGGDDGEHTHEERAASDPLSWIPATVVPSEGTPTGIVSGWLANKARASQETGGFFGAIGHMANGTAAGVVSLFDVVVPRCAADLYSVVLFGRGVQEPPSNVPVRTREAAAFADYIYDSKFNDAGAEAGGLLGQFGVPYNPVGGLQAALFRGESGTFYLVARGTELFSVEDWMTNVEQAGGSRTEAYEAFVALVRALQKQIADAGGTLVCAGHSMGGGLAIAGARASGLPAEAFNPAYVNEVYNRGQPAQIRVNVVHGDALELSRHILDLPAQGEMHWYRSRPCKGMNHGMEHFIDNR
jgi:hypothetical protein